MVQGVVLCHRRRVHPDQPARRPPLLRDRPAHQARRCTVSTVTAAAGATAAPAVADGGAPPRPRRLLRQLRRNRLAFTGGVIAALFVLAALAAPLISPYDPARADFGSALAQPGWATGSAPTTSAATSSPASSTGPAPRCRSASSPSCSPSWSACRSGWSAGYYGRFADSLRLPAHRHHAGVPVPGAGRRPRRDPRPVADERHHRDRHLPGPAVIRVTRAETLRLKHVDYVGAAIANGGWRRHRALPAHPAQRHLRTASCRRPWACRPPSSARRCSASWASESSRPTRRSA